MDTEHLTNKICAVFLVLVIFMGFLLSDSYGFLGRMSSYPHQSRSELNSPDAITLSGLEKDYAERIPHKTKLINLNGTLSKALGFRDFYSDKNIYVTDDGYIVGIYPKTSTDHEFINTADLNSFLKNNGIELIYVNEPVKYDDDEFTYLEFGLESHVNRNATVFLDRIRAEGIPVIDLRDNAKTDGINSKQLFYRTDHHWTVPAGLWAARIMAEGLNEYAGYDIDPGIFDDSEYSYTEYKNCWLGEQGQMMGAGYTGLDDYTEIKPVFTTDYTFKEKGGDVKGSFDDFINESIYTSGNDVHTSPSWHYSYSLRNCINNNVDKGKILMLVDSYDHVTEPFLSLAVHELDTITIRNCDPDFDLKSYITENGYDTVMICYAEFMIGAHDNPQSANYRMFDF